MAKKKARKNKKGQKSKKNTQVKEIRKESTHDYQTEIQIIGKKEKEMSEKHPKINRLVLTMFVETIYIILVEMILKALLGSRIFDWSTLRIVISSTLLAGLISLISNVKRPTYRKIILSIFNLVVVFYAWLQIGFMDYLGAFMSLGNAEQGGKIKNYIFDFLTAYKIMDYLIYIPFILGLIYFFYIETKKIEVSKIKTSLQGFKPKFALLVYFVLFSIIFYGTVQSNVMQGKYQTISNAKLFKNPSNPSIAIKNFGTTAYFILDLKSTIEGTNNEIIAGLTDEIQEKREREIDDTLWKELIEEETDTTKNTLNKYFINRSIPDKNDYTGLFEDKNVIMILLESIGFAVFDTEYKDYFPTLYKMYKEGMSSINNYSPRNNCGTGESEMTSEISLYSIETTCTVNTYEHNIYPEALMNMFKKSGYYTSAYHDYNDYYYDRNIYEYNFGIETYMDAPALGIDYTEEYKEWPSDLELMEKALPHFIDKEKFATYIVTVTAHTPYKYSSEYGDMYLSLFDDLDIDITLKRYLSKIKVVDIAIEYLLKELENAGKLEDTVIVLYGDHYPYALGEKDYGVLAQYDVITNQEVDRTPFIIYNKGINPKTIEKYMTPMDYAPTIMNLFGLDYDPRHYVGNDIFSNYEDFILYADNSWQNKNGFYSATKGEFIPKNSSSLLEDSEIMRMNEKVETLRTMSNLAIKTDYFNYLYSALDKKQKEKEIAYNEKESLVEEDAK